MEPLYSDSFYFLGLIVLMPLLGAIINGLFGAKLPRNLVNWVACGAMALSFAFALVSLQALVNQGNGEEVGHLSYTAFQWIFSGSLNAEIAFLFDPLSAVLVLIITGVGLLIHIYSTGYMAEDPSKWRYFAYLNLFVFAMLLLALGKNMLVTFIGWEGVGMASYLLIGFWYSDADKAAAGQKAFIVNRVGDFFFLLGMFILYFTVGTWDYLELEALATNTATAALLLPVALPVGVLIFLGCTGKSAQIPLYVWLPDAMAGPTPVSALIHAATMVTAGVFLLSRINWIFTLDPNLMAIVAVVGSLTALMAATIAIVQTDIKKVLAYSTVSQLGFMFMAVGVGSFTAAVFHLMTHAFFKALLFLAAGSVIHGMHHEQDMRKMGGLKKYMPWTHAAFLIGTLAIAGVPFFAGFYSKDFILWSALSNVHVLNVVGVLETAQMEMFTTTLAPAVVAAEGHALEVLGGALFINWFVFIVGVLTAGLTAFYMFRAYFMTFHGECRADEETKSHIHESPSAMLVALLVLSFLSVVGGYIGWPHFIAAVFPKGLKYYALGLEHWLAEVFVVSDTYRVIGRFGEHPYLAEGLAAATSVIIAGVGIGLAYLMYVKRTDLPGVIHARVTKLHYVLSNKYFVDEGYFAAFVRPTLLIGKVMTWFDKNIISGLLVGGAAFMTQNLGRILRNLQSGNVQRYATYISLALALVVLAIFYPGCLA
ncbi:NADH-quinone oxidoreductase subunit L [Lujinxingia vulgaris]|uniref:NADH-quinone oxidoreductase subunit L n=1 Tax=Lujinxingia vulgaris TaxID=2600176 RepID=A0A5C6XHI0_9DELT|nr:NADH-quinone oxidoreductase subunit L [Lujinxingia vulgaris]TXD43740.1 NADH-quinone oxidoreductase subunit L [Lujinxingia vulgaris]